MAPRSAAVCVLRNAVDILPVLIGHYLDAGFDRLCFVDDGSTDGSREFLAAVSRRVQCLHVSRHDADTFDQERIVNAQVNALIAEGFTLVFPFDADEFWLVDLRTLMDRLGAFPRGCAIHGRWVNFVQSRNPGDGSEWSTSIRYRVPAGDLASAEDVMGFQRGFVSVQLTKTAVFSSEPVALSRGQHRFTQGPQDWLEGEQEIFHLPLRSRAELDKRALDYEPRRAPHRPAETVSWQSRFFAEAVCAGHAERIWKANSADAAGTLSLSDGAYPLVADSRFSELAARALRRFRALGVSVS